MEPSLGLTFQCFSGSPVQAPEAVPLGRLFILNEPLPPASAPVLQEVRGGTVEGGHLDLGSVLPQRIHA